MPNVVVELGRTTQVPKLTMAIQPVMMAPVVVKGTQSAVRIDPVHTAGGGNLSVKDYELLPVDRDYKSIITILPVANDSYRGDAVNVGDSTGMENQYYIDGVNVTDPGTSERATSLPYNFVRAVDVKTDGYGAQYGRALGAPVNAVTYSGTNDFEINVFGYVQPGAWAMDPAVAPVVEEQEPVTYDFGARLSGPLAKNRLWYSVAADPRVDQDFRAIGVEFDLWKGESDADPLIPGMVEELKAKGLAVPDQGALVVRVARPDDKRDIPPLLVVSSEGAAMYGTTDLATILDRRREQDPHLMLYVVDQRQADHFEQVFRAAYLGGYAEEGSLEHLGFGTMNGADGKPFKTRAGGVLKLADLIEMTRETWFDPGDREVARGWLERLGRTAW